MGGKPAGGALGRAEVVGTAGGALLGLAEFAAGVSVRPWISRLRLAGDAMACDARTVISLTLLFEPALCLPEI